MRSRGRAAVPLEGGLIVLSNHRSDADPVVLQAATPRYIRFMSKSEIFEMPIVGWLTRWAMAFPVKRGEADRAALKTAASLAQEGWAVGIFPEGELSKTGTMGALKPGIALIIRMADVPVVCVAVRGSERIIPYGFMLPRPAFGGVSTNWGDPRHFPKCTPAEEIMEWAEAELRQLGAE